MAWATPLYFALVLPQGKTGRTISLLDASASVLPTQRTSEGGVCAGRSYGVRFNQVSISRSAWSFA